MEGLRQQIEVLKEELKNCPTPEQVKAKVNETEAKIREVEEKQREESANSDHILEKVKAYEMDMKDKMQQLYSLQDVK
jgi:chromosome segregation ATPase